MNDPVIRCLDLAKRLWVAGREFGVRDGVRVCITDRNCSTPGLHRVHIRALRRTFAYRTQTEDRAVVVTHFCTPQLRLIDSSHTPIRTIVDVGAFIGDETLRLRAFHPEARIWAVEADPDNVAILEQNVRDFANIVPSALWSHSGGVQIASGGANGQQSRVASIGVHVPSLTIGDLLERCGGSIDFLKLDVEGAERTIFGDPRAAAWLQQVGVLAVECPDSDAPGATLCLTDALRRSSRDWTCHVVGELLVWRQAHITWGVSQYVGFPRAPVQSS